MPTAPSLLHMTSSLCSQRNWKQRCLFSPNIGEVQHCQSYHAHLLFNRGILDHRLWRVRACPLLPNLECLDLCPECIVKNYRKQSLYTEGFLAVGGEGGSSRVVYVFSAMCFLRLSLKFPFCYYLTAQKFRG